MDIFDKCKAISSLIDDNKSLEARNELIKMLDYHEQENIEYTPVVNHLIRQTGLYPYLDTANSIWQDQLVYELFKVDTGDKEEKTLHIEQANLLKKLVEGKNIAVSAPTSFGKSFVIDAFIALTKPAIVVIIVPTLALTDETRRRLQKKFSDNYKIITTPDVEFAEKNILIFPQERAISYIEKLTTIDILVIDEFYKASIAFDKDRAPILLKTILELGSIAKQKYFLAPNISTLKDSPFTQGMEFISLDFNTVFTEKY
jgi:reverse gyrase